MSPIREKMINGFPKLHGSLIGNNISKFQVHGVTMFLDLETTGYFTQDAEITEIAAAVPILHELDCDFYYQTKSGKFLVYNSLVKTKRKVGKKIEELNGITNEILKYESEFPVVSKEFHHFLDFVRTHSQNGKIAMVSHNGFAFDYKFLFKQTKIKSNLENIIFFDSLDYFKKKKRQEQVEKTPREVEDLLKANEGYIKDLKLENSLLEQSNRVAACNLKKHNIDCNIQPNLSKKKRKNPFLSPRKETYSLSSLSLKNLYSLYFGKPFEGHHRAKHDAIALSEIVLKSHDLNMDHWQSKKMNDVYVNNSFVKKDMVSANSVIKKLQVRV